MNYMHLSVNPLKPRTKEFLETENPIGFNKSAFRGELRKRLDKSIRYLHHILKFPQNLTNYDVDDKINALTIHLFLERILIDFDKSWNPKRYDFRTIELARTLFHVSANYLQGSPLYKQDELVKYDIERLSRDFRTIAKTELEKQAHVTISEEEEHKLNEELEKIKKEEEFQIHDPKGELYKLNKLYEKLVKKQTDYHNVWAKLENLLPELKSKKGIKLVEFKEKIKIARSLRDSLKEKIYEIQDQKEMVLKKYREERNKQNEKLSHKFDHLQGYYCPLDILQDFALKGNLHLNKDDSDQEFYSTLGL